MRKNQEDKAYIIEKKFVATIRDKMNALSHAQFLKERGGKSKDKPRKYSQLSSSERQRIRRAKTQGLHNEIHLLLCACGFTPHIRNPNLSRATPEENLAIRFDFDGIIHRPESHFLSDPYRNAKHSFWQSAQQIDETSCPLFQHSDYNLNNSPVWQELSKFTNYQKISSRIITQLQKNNIPPSVVTTMNYYDFIDAIAENYKETRSRPFESTRSQNLKMFAYCYGHDFFQIMTSLHYEANAIRKMLRQMRNGSCPEIFDLHHKTNITNFRELKNPEEINSFPNMLLTFIHPHHRSLHFGKGYDIDKNIVFFGGYDPNYQIYRNPQKEQQYMRKIGKLINNAKSH